MNIKLGVIVSLVVALAFTAMTVSAQLEQKKGLTLAIAKQVAAAAEAEAVKNKNTVVISIVDDGGNLLYLERMDDADLAGVEIATGKAHTAVVFKRPTKALEDEVTGGRNALLTLMPGAVLVGGGLPIKAEGKVIGGIGVGVSVGGGGTPLSEAVAKAGVDAFDKMFGH